MRLIRTSFRQLLCSPRRQAGGDWWAYFGSFGNDIFDED